MATVIPADKVQKHNIDRYSFKVFAVGTNSQNEEEKKSVFEKETHIEEAPRRRRSSDVDSSALNTQSKDSLIESLMKKTDEMSSNFIKLQMKLEAKEEEFEQELKEAKEHSYTEGLEAGKNEAKGSLQADVTQRLDQLFHSIQTLDASAQEFESALSGIKNELIAAALDIAKEVIKVEVDEHSSEIAKVLSDELIKELQGASKVTIKVNPKDHGEISQHVGALAHVEVISDPAISAGGIVVISDAGNIDTQISKRFERVKKAALSE